RTNHATDDAFAATLRGATSSTSAPVVVDAEPAPAERPLAPAVDAAQASVRREGDFWRVTFAAKTVLIRHSRGLSLLGHLLCNPKQRIHVAGLDAIIPSGAGTALSSNAPVGARVGDLGDAGEVLDAQAKAAYRRRLGELREELEDAERCNDLGRIERLRI